MTVQIEDAYGVTDINAISRLEAKRKIKLPEEFVQFLLQSNGGCPEPDGFQVPGWEHRASGVKCFFGVHNGKFNNLELEWERYGRRIPEILAPIASDDFGNLICIAVSGPQQGAIFFWDHEGELDDRGQSRLDFANIFLVAQTFKEFLDKLSFDP